MLAVWEPRIIKNDDADKSKGLGRHGIGTYKVEHQVKDKELRAL